MIHSNVLKAILLSVIMLFVVQPCSYAADEWVRGYYRQDGKYVEAYKRTYKDRTLNNNHSTRGNFNPYTGKKGYKPRDEDVYKQKRRRNKRSW